MFFIWINNLGSALTITILCMENNSISVTIENENRLSPCTLLCKLGKIRDKILEININQYHLILIQLNINTSDCDSKEFI